MLDQFNSIYKSAYGYWIYTYLTMRKLKITLQFQHFFIFDSPYLYMFNKPMKIWMFHHMVDDGSTLYKSKSVSVTKYLFLYSPPITISYAKSPPAVTWAAGWFSSGGQFPQHGPSANTVIQPAMSFARRLTFSSACRLSAAFFSTIWHDTFRSLT